MPLSNIELCMCDVEACVHTVARTATRRSHSDARWSLTSESCTESSWLSATSSDVASYTSASDVALQAPAPKSTTSMSPTYIREAAPRCQGDDLPPSRLDHTADKKEWVWRLLDPLAWNGYLVLSFISVIIVIKDVVNRDLFHGELWPSMSILSTVNWRLVIPLSFGDCNTPINKAAYKSRNNDHVSHKPTSKVA